MTIAKTGARSVADVGAGIILATVEIAAPAERVFRAITSDEIKQWWGSPEMYRTTEYTADLRPGGAWRAAGVGADGAPFSVEGLFREVEPPRRLVQTWRAGWDGGHETILTYSLEAIDGGTRVTLRHEGFGERHASCRSHGQGWARVLDWLSSHLAADQDRHFLCRLLAPRPTFMLDMTEEEKGIMGRHAMYWAELLAKGVAVVFGPVADPKGGWGVGIIRAPSEAAMNALRDADPAILSGHGFSYEILPMLRAVYRN